LASILIERNRLEICRILAWANAMQRPTKFADRSKMVLNLLKLRIAPDFPQAIAKFIGQL
jgi:hypothetical protein